MAQHLADFLLLAFSIRKRCSASMTGLRLAFGKSSILRWAATCSRNPRSCPSPCRGEGLTMTHEARQRHAALRHSLGEMSWSRFSTKKRLARNRKTCWKRARLTATILESSHAWLGATLRNMGQSCNPGTWLQYPSPSARIGSLLQGHRKAQACEKHFHDTSFSHGKSPEVPSIDPHPGKSW